MTCVDGTSEVSQDLSKYQNVKVISHQEISDLENGSIIKAYIGYTAIGKIYKSSNGIFFIQPLRQSTARPSSNNWISMGKYSWKLVANSTYRDAYLLNPLDNVESLNYLIHKSETLSNKKIIYANDEAKVRKITENADFSLILNLDDVKNLPSLSLKNKTRSEYKSSILSNDDIKKLNIQKYISSLSDKTDISSDLPDISKILPKIFAWNLSSFFILFNLNLDDFRSILDLYYKSIKNKTFYTSDIKYYISRSLKTVSKYYPSGTKCTEHYIKNCNENAKEMIEEFIKLGSDINSKILKKEINNLEDLEIALQKITSISNIIRSSRYTIRTSESIFSDILSDNNRSLEYLNNPGNKSKIETLKEDIKTIRRIVNKI